MFGNPTMTHPTSTPNAKRHGCYPMRIGFMMDHVLEHDLTLPSGRRLKARQKVHLSVQDITRHVDAAPHTTWICRHPDCAGKRWESKAKLLNDHPPNKDLAKAEQTHLFYAVAWVPGVDAQEEKRAKDGAIVQEKRDAQLPKLVLLSDEE